MSKKEGTAVPAEVQGAEQAAVTEKAKKVKKPSAESKKLHVEIARGNWKRLERYLDTYNKDPERNTPKLRQADVINQALVAYFEGNSSSKGKR